MHQPWEWTEADLQNLITEGTQESLTLDYKRKESLTNNDHNKNELGKDVSAFANSAGGTIVYGMVETNHLPIQLDDGFDPTVTTKEWIEHVINGRIQQKIDGIVIKPVPLTSPPGNTAYVVTIPQSLRAPHMASDNKYYKRYNFESIPMEDYEVRDVRRRQESPLLSIELSKLKRVPNNRAELTFRIRNESPALALYSLTMIRVSPPATIQGSGGWNGQHELPIGHVFQKTMAPPEHLPIWEGVPLSLDVTLTVGCADWHDFYLEWIVESPNMSRQSGVIWLQAINGVITRVEDQAVIEELESKRLDMNWVDGQEVK